MKKYLVISILVSVLGATAFYFYTEYNKEKLDIWQFVPAEAMLVYENDNTYRTFEKMQSTRFGNSILGIEEITNKIGELQHLDTVVNKNALATLFSDTKFLTSLHVTAKGTMDGVFYLELNKVNQADVLNDWIKHFSNSYTVNQRKYNGFTINEIIGGQTVFTYLIKDNVFVGSYTPFLIEDVIRNLNSKEKGFFKANASLFKNHNSISDQGNLYVTKSGLDKLNEVFFKEKQEVDANIKAFFELSLKDNLISTDGFLAKSPNTYEQLLEQKAGENRIVNWLPECTAIAEIYTLSDPLKWKKSMDLKKSKKLLKLEDDYFSNFALSADKTLNWLGKEITLMECKSVEVQGKVLMLASSDLPETLNQFNSFAEEVAKSKGDTLHYEYFSNKKIVEVQLPDVPAVLLGNSFQGFDALYYTSQEGYFMVGSSSEVLKKVLKQQEEELTWGKINYYTKFLNENIKEYNYTKVWNSSKLWTYIIAQLNDNWKSFFNRNDGLFKSFDLACFQVSNIDGRLFSNASIYQGADYKPANSKNRVLPSVKKAAFTTVLKNNVNSKPFAVKNHKDNSREILLLDASNLLYLINSKGSILWTDSLKSPIVDKMYQIDYYKNNKLQYLILGKEQVYLIDRNGNPVEGYPKAHGIRNPQFLSLIDYDNNKNYRIMIANSEGQISLFDKDLKQLNGWDKLEFGGSLSTRPFHVRVRGKDCYVMATKQGTLHLVNRKGQTYSGFPVNLKNGIEGEVYFNRKSSFDKSELVVITSHGVQLKVGLNGEKSNPVQLAFNADQSSFQLVKDVTGSAYLIARQGGNRLELLNADQKVVMAKDYMSNENKQIQYFNLDNGNFYIAVNDVEQEFTYLYNKEGRLINQSPINSKAEIAMMIYSRANQLKIYSVYKNQLNIYNF